MYNKLTFNNWIWFFWLCLLNTIAAQSPGPVNPSEDPGSIVAAVILMIVGLVFVFAGKRLIKIVVAIAGFFTLFFIVLGISTFIVDWDNLTRTQTILIWVFACLFGIFGALIAWFIWKVGIVIFGFLFGLNVGQWITRINFTSNTNIQLGIIIAFAVVGALIALFFMNFVIIIGTAFTGAQLFMCGVDLITRTGFIQFRANAVDNGVISSPTPAVWGMMASVLVITIIGALFQWKTTPKNAHKY